MDDLSYLLANGMTLDEIQKYLDDGITFEELGEAARSLIARGESIASRDPEPEAPPVKPLRIISAQELQEADLPPTRFLVENLLPEGTSLVSAASKIGKSWMVLDLGLCLASGKPFLGRKTHQSGVLYLALEDSLGRLQDRMNKILGDQKAPPDFHFTVEAPKLDGGLLETIDGHLARHPETKLCIIDTLQRIRGQALPRESGYAQDYREMETVKNHMAQLGLSVLFVHHNRKMRDDDDPFNMISGTNGIMGAADTIWVLIKEKRGDGEAVLHVTGRDLPQQEAVVRFQRQSWRWEMVGAAADLEARRAREEYDRNPVVMTIRKLLQQSPGHRWEGTSKELLEAGRYLVRQPLAPDSQRLGFAIRNLEGPLLEYDGVGHMAANRGTAGKKHTFYYNGENTFEEVETLFGTPYPPPEGGLTPVGNLKNCLES